MLARVRDALLLARMLCTTAAAGVNSLTFTTKMDAA